MTYSTDNLPSTIAESTKWLLTLSEDLDNKQEDFKLALKAVADKFDWKVADLKTAIKAVKDDKVPELLEGLDNKRDVIEAVSHQD